MEIGPPGATMGNAVQRSVVMLVWKREKDFVTIQQLAMEEKIVQESPLNNCHALENVQEVIRFPWLFKWKKNIIVKGYVRCDANIVSYYYGQWWLVLRC